MIMYRDARVRVVCDNCQRFARWASNKRLRSTIEREWAGRMSGKSPYVIYMREKVRTRDRSVKFNAFEGSVQLHFCSRECAEEFRPTPHAPKYLHMIWKSGDLTQVDIENSNSTVIPDA